MVLFGPENKLSAPVIQVSLLHDESDSAATTHMDLGRALAPLRDQGIVIVASGMAVHNLRDMFQGNAGPGTPAREYASGFDEALRDAMEAVPGRERDEKMEALLRGKDLAAAHPSLEHLLPVFVAAGAAGEDAGRRVWTLVEGSASWAQFRFG